jgi:hypothetical protein
MAGASEENMGDELGNVVMALEVKFVHGEFDVSESLTVVLFLYHKEDV